MKRNMMLRNLFRSIGHSLGRYIAIGLIIALGAGMFVGLRSTKRDMVATGQEYMDRQNMFDLRLISTYGWGRNQVAQIAALDGVVDAEGIFYLDLIANRGEDGEGSVYRFYNIPQDVNRLVLLEGRMPLNPDECLADGYRNGKKSIGTTVTIAENNSEDSLDKIQYRTFTIVGTVSTPLYMDMNRGNTSVGSGSISNYFFVPESAFDVDYYTEIHVTIPGSYAIYSARYNDAMSDAADVLKPLLIPIAEERLNTVRTDAIQEYRDGMEEYLDGVREYETKKSDAMEELEDAWRELEDAEYQLRSTQEQLKNGEVLIAEGRVSIREGRKTLAQSRQALASARASAYQETTGATQELLLQEQDIATRKQQVDNDLLQINLALIQVESEILQFELGITDPDEATRAAAYAEQARLQESQAALQRESDSYAAAQESVMGALAELAAKTLIMEQQFALADSQLEAGEAQLDYYEAELEAQEKAIADGWIQYEEGVEKYRQGRADFWEAWAEARREFADAEEELADTADKLADAKQTIDGMTETQVYVLDRNTNMGYSSLDSSSDIVAGVSKVFPAFFLLVAALVCITTMTRMVDEERTQIGTLKALGYSSQAIISKYMIYAGSSAILGCVIGITAGSIGFPMVLWEAYKIMIFITPRIALRFDWLLALGVVVMYTGAMLLVTWYCCHRELMEVPAELIRPKAPTAGKQLLLERLPIWKKFSFLNKVAARNIFRYRQRLAMMLLGIGGCTALLMTGFGLRDSIEKIVDVQFREVMVYDMEVYFRESCTEEDQLEFRNTMSPYADDILFFNQSSVEINAQNQTREIYLIAASEDIAGYMNFHSGSQELEYPGLNEILLSAGICDIMGIRQGDEILLRNPDMEEMHLTVSGVYDNHVYNYAVIAPQTMEAQWGKTPELQMAFVTVREGQDSDAAGAAATGADGVMSVTVNTQLANTVSVMMKALDLVIIVVVFCAGLLAVVVLYNLTNININERIREIATIKVLGFNALETAMYVFKENLVLSIMGTVFGLPLGKLLLDFVISQIRIDMIWLKPRLEWPSLVASVILTVISAVVVDVVFYYKLDRINMAEALKSVE